MRLFLFILAFISIPVEAGAAKNIECGNAWGWKLFINRYEEGKAFLSYIHRDGTFGYDATESVDQEKDLTWFHFEGGSLVIESAILRDEVLSANAATRIGEYSSRYACTRR